MSKPREGDMLSPPDQRDDSRYPMLEAIGNYLESRDRMGQDDRRVIPPSKTRGGL